MADYSAQSAQMARVVKRLAKSLALRTIKTVGVISGDTKDVGISISFVTAALEVTVTLEQRPPGRDETIQRTLRSSILLRN